MLAHCIRKGILLRICLYLVIGCLAFDPFFKCCFSSRSLHQQRSTFFKAFSFRCDLSSFCCRQLISDGSLLNPGPPHIAGCQCERSNVVGKGNHWLQGKRRQGEQIMIKRLYTLAMFRNQLLLGGFGVSDSENAQKWKLSKAEWNGNVQIMTGKDYKGYRIYTYGLILTISLNH